MNNKVLALIIRGYATELLQIAKDMNTECLEGGMEEETVLTLVAKDPYKYLFDLRSASEKIASGTHSYIGTGDAKVMRQLYDFIETMEADIERLLTD